MNDDTNLYLPLWQSGLHHNKSEDEIPKSTLFTLIEEILEVYKV